MNKVSDRTQQTPLRDYQSKRLKWKIDEAKVEKKEKKRTLEDGARDADFKPLRVHARSEEMKTRETSDAPHISSRGGAFC